MIQNVIKSFVQEYNNRLDIKTVERYQKAVVELWKHSNKLLTEISTRDIRNWLAHLESLGYHPSTRNTRLFGVKLFYQYCLEEGLLDKNPAESIPPSIINEKLPYYLSMEQLTQIRNTSDNNLRDRAIVETLYVTGVRISELVAMKKEDLNWEERYIYIPKGKRKKPRIVLFTQECKQLLLAYLQNRNDDHLFLFLNPYGTRQASLRNIQDRFENYTEKLGFYVTPHTLRHTFAAHLAMKGMSLECIQSLLGHEDARDTLHYAKLYDHARKEQYDEWM